MIDFDAGVLLQADNTAKVTSYLLDHILNVASWQLSNNELNDSSGIAI